MILAATRVLPGGRETQGQSWRTAVMQYALLLIGALAVSQPDALGSGDHKRTITVDEKKREHWVHVPPKYDAKKPTPVVVALHGATMWHKLMETFTGLDKTA